MRFVESFGNQARTLLTTFRLLRQKFAHHWMVDINVQTHYMDLMVSQTVDISTPGIKFNAKPEREISSLAAAMPAVVS